MMFVWTADFITSFPLFSSLFVFSSTVVLPINTTLGFIMNNQDLVCQQWEVLEQNLVEGRDGWLLLKA